MMMLTRTTVDTGKETAMHEPPARRSEIPGCSHEGMGTYRDSGRNERCAACDRMVSNMPPARLLRKTWNPTPAEWRAFRKQSAYRSLTEVCPDCYEVKMPSLVGEITLTVTVG